MYVKGTSLVDAPKDFSENSTQITLPRSEAINNLFLSPGPWIFARPYMLVCEETEVKAASLRVTVETVSPAIFVFVLVPTLQLVPRAIRVA